MSMLRILNISNISSDSVIGFEQVNACWVCSEKFVILISVVFQKFCRYLHIY